VSKAAFFQIPDFSTSKDFNGLSDPFCQITIGNTIRKTKTIPTQLNPKFNELFIFDYEVGVRYIEIMVFDEDLTNSPDFMGVINIPIFDLYDGDIIEDNDLYGEEQKSALEILEEKKKGKEIKAVDHSKIEYIAFRKNLYIVPRALSMLTDEENNDRREDLQIKVRGKGCPALVDYWDQCGLSERLLQLIEKHNLQEPFPIQKQAIPAIAGTLIQ
jgi:hypothetical protein